MKKKESTQFFWEAENYDFYFLAYYGFTTNLGHFPNSSMTKDRAVQTN